MKLSLFFSDFIKNEVSMFSQISTFKLIIIIKLAKMILFKKFYFLVKITQNCLDLVNLKIG